MKVDFTKFPLFTGIDRQDMVIADIRKDIADGILQERARSSGARTCGEDLSERACGACR